MRCHTRSPGGMNSIKGVIRSNLPVHRFCRICSLGDRIQPLALVRCKIIRHHLWRKYKHIPLSYALIHLRTVLIYSRTNNITGLRYIDRGVCSSSQKSTPCYLKRRGTVTIGLSVSTALSDDGKGLGTRDTFWYSRKEPRLGSTLRKSRVWNQKHYPNFSRVCGISNYQSWYHISPLHVE